jgi:hypothetical protein
MAVVCWSSPCKKLPPAESLRYYNMDSEADDFYAGGTGVTSGGLKHFPQLWWDCFFCCFLYVFFPFYHLCSHHYSEQRLQPSPL